jgi:3-hydroxyanthranilate 3,4-dioxygenase
MSTWIAQNADKLLPPICNVMMFGLGCEFKIMIVGGPNARTDYHVEDGEEWFYQLKGDMLLKIVDLNGNPQDIPIREGECFLLPANIPHSPQRFPNTLGLVIERERDMKESDHLRWYCRQENCRNIVFDKSFHCKDLGKELPPVIAEYYGSEQLRTCSQCGTVDQRL